MDKLSDGSKCCPVCNVYILPVDWKVHKGSKRCQELTKSRTLREEAMRGALSDVNKFFGGRR